MTEEGTLCGNSDVEKLGGANASSTSDAEAYTNVYIKMIEGQLCLSARYDWVTNYSSISDIGKKILRLACASGAAALVENYDMGGFTSRQEALTMLNVNWANYQKVIDLLEKDNKYKDFILTGVGDVD